MSQAEIVRDTSRLQIFFNSDGGMTVIGKCRAITIEPPFSDKPIPIPEHNFVEDEEYSASHDDPENDGLACQTCGRFYYPTPIDGDEDYEDLENMQGRTIISALDVIVITRALKQYRSSFDERRVGSLVHTLESLTNGNYSAFHYYLIPDMKEVVERAQA